jgi:hypothetical protein
MRLALILTTTIKVVLDMQRLFVVCAVRPRSSSSCAPNGSIYGSPILEIAWPVGTPRVNVSLIADARYKVMATEDEMGFVNGRLLTRGHNTQDKREVKRLLQEHPNEPEVLYNNRVVGAIMVTRGWVSVAAARVLAHFQQLSEILNSR